MRVQEPKYSNLPDPANHPGKSIWRICGNPIPPGLPVSLLITAGTNKAAFLRYRQTDRADKPNLMLTEFLQLFLEPWDPFQTHLIRTSKGRGEGEEGKGVGEGGASRSFTYRYTLPQGHHTHPLSLL
jgi:hypothetical protein